MFLLLGQDINRGYSTVARGYMWKNCEVNLEKKDKHKLNTSFHWGWVKTSEQISSWLKYFITGWNQTNLTWWPNHAITTSHRACKDIFPHTLVKEGIQGSILFYDIRIWSVGSIDQVPIQSDKPEVSRSTSGSHYPGYFRNLIIFCLMHFHNFCNPPLMTFVDFLYIYGRNGQPS